MGEQRRERTRDFFSLGWLLDPGRNERRDAMDLQRNAANQWNTARWNLPDSEWLDTQVHTNPLSGLVGDENYQAGRDAEMQALRQMQGIANAGGYTDVERGQIRQAQQQAAQYERSQRQAALQQMQQRGMSGGGAELASRLQAQQGGANRAANDATNIATAAQQRALQAMQNTAQIGANQQETGLKRAGAIDAFNRANMEARGRARQQEITNDMQALAGQTGQYNSNAQSAYNQAQQQAAAAQGLVTSIIGAVA